MARYTVNLRTDLVDYIAETIRHNDLGKLDIWPAGAMDHRVAALTERQAHYFENLTSEDDGLIEDGVMWIGGTDYPVEIVHNA